MRKRRGAVVSVLAGLGIGVGVLRAITPRDLDWIADVLDEVLDAVEIGIESGWNEGVAELIIAKQRNGPTGTVKLAFNGKYARFDDVGGLP